MSIMRAFAAMRHAGAGCFGTAVAMLFVAVAGFAVYQLWVVGDYLLALGIAGVTLLALAVLGLFLLRTLRRAASTLTTGVRYCRVCGAPLENPRRCDRCGVSQQSRRH